MRLEKTNIVPNKNIVYFLNPDYLYIPIKKSNMLVRQNEGVYKNQIIDKTIVSSPVSGMAVGLSTCNVLGKRQSTLVIANDFRELEGSSKGRKKEITVANILKVLEVMDKKLLEKFKSNRVYNNIVIKVINDNPYVYNKVYLLKEKLMEVLNLVERLSLLYKSEQSVLVIKNNDSFVIDDCLNTIGSYPGITLTLVNDEYLLEQDDILKEKLNLKDNILFLDIEDIIKLNDLLNNNISTTKLITISGDAIKESKVFRVKKYTLLKDVMDKYIDINTNNYEITVNGLMTGFRINEGDNLVIDENIDSINIMHKNNNKSSACIRCGKCIDVCPKGVNPITLENKEKCIDCGLCSYVCPSFINLRKKLKGE